MSKNISKTKSKNSSGKYRQKRLNHAKQSATGAESILKKQLKKQQKELVILLTISLLMKLLQPQEFHHIIVYRQLQMKQNILDLIEKYQKGDIYISRKKTENYWWCKIN